VSEATRGDGERVALTDEQRGRLKFYLSHRSGPDSCRTRHIGLCGRKDKGGECVPPEVWVHIHPAFRCAACNWILRGASS
jgi:hypothetical protein